MRTPLSAGRGGSGLCLRGENEECSLRASQGTSGRDVPRFGLPPWGEELRQPQAVQFLAVDSGRRMNRPQPTLGRQLAQSGNGLRPVDRVGNRTHAAQKILQAEGGQPGLDARGRRAQRGGVARGAHRPGVELATRQDRVGVAQTEDGAAEPGDAPQVGPSPVFARASTRRVGLREVGGEHVHGIEDPTEAPLEEARIAEAELAHLQVHVRARAVARAAHSTDFVAGEHEVAGADPHGALLQVGHQRCHVLAAGKPVRDDDQISPAREASGLQDEAVRTELDLVDEQVTKLQEIGTKIREDVQASFQGIDFGSFRDLSEDERNARMAEIREKADKITAEGQKEIDAVLLPHQRERLKQLQVQSQMRFGADRALSSDPLAKDLGITDAQKEQLRTKQEEIEASLNEKIAKLRTEAREELFSVLTTAQQDKLKGMIGKPFTFTGGPGGPPGFGGGGGFGGRGGDGAPGAPGGRGRRGQRPDGN